MNPDFQNNIWLIVLLFLWTLPWKGWALWRAAQFKRLGWFIILLLVNTLGALEILYIFVISNPKFSSAIVKKISVKQIKDIK